MSEHLDDLLAAGLYDPADPTAAARLELFEFLLDEVGASIPELVQADEEGHLLVTELRDTDLPGAGRIDPPVADRLVAFGLGQDVRCANGGSRFAKRRRVRVYHAERVESEIAHGPGNRSNVKRVARSDQHNAEAVEFIGRRHGFPIVRHLRDCASLGDRSDPSVNSDSYHRTDELDMRTTED